MRDFKEFDITKIMFEEAYVEDGETTYYFIVPLDSMRESFKKKYPEAVSVEICLKFIGPVETSNVEVGISPTKEENDGLTDYDWEEFAGLRETHIKELMDLAKKGMKGEIK